MKTILTVLATAGVVLSLTTTAQEQTPKPLNTLERLPRDLEIQLALSSLPQHLRDNATVYVLNPKKGFEAARTGSNGFHALVARTGDDTFRGAWPFRAYRDDILYPVSFDDAGAKANMRVFFDAAELQAKGTLPEELKRIIQDRYRTHVYQAPERAGVSYMLSPILRTYVNPDHDDSVSTANVPHVMYYTPNLSNEAVGAATPAPDEFRHLIDRGRWRHTPDPFAILHGPHGYLVQFLGVTERAAINRAHAVMLERLCEIKKVWCLPKEDGPAR